jgi:hypothetical protein
MALTRSPATTAATGNRPFAATERNDPRPFNSMKLLTKNTILGTSLVALAILNFSVLDQIGVGLVSSVNDNFEDLGADWIALQTADAGIDSEAVAASLQNVAGSKQIMTSTSWSQISRSPTGISGVEWLIPGPGYGLDQEPYLFVFQEDEATGAAFYRDQIQWEAGALPGATGFAASSDYVRDNARVLGETVSFSIGGNPFNGDSATPLNLTLEGVYQRAYADASGNAFDILIVSNGGDAADTIQTQPNLRQTILAQATLASILQASDALVDGVEKQGFTVGTENFQIGGRTFGGRQGGGPGGGGGFGGPGAQGGQGGQQTAPSDFALYANGEVLADALDAAERAGTWFRMLTASAVVMALVGIGFVTAAMERKVRRDVGIRQAVGYPVQRIWMHWAFVATTMGVAGGAIGVVAVYVLSATGLAETLLGIPITFRISIGAILAPVASVAVFALATLPTYAKVLRSAPSENLRVLSE